MCKQRPRIKENCQCSHQSLSKIKLFDRISPAFKLQFLCPKYLFSCGQTQGLLHILVPYLTGTNAKWTELEKYILCYRPCSRTFRARTQVFCSSCLTGNTLNKHLWNLWVTQDKQSQRWYASHWIRNCPLIFIVHWSSCHSRSHKNVSVIFLFFSCLDFVLELLDKI